jgi:hypothetical protein
VLCKKYFIEKLNEKMFLSVAFVNTIAFSGNKNTINGEET